MAAKSDSKHPKVRALLEEGTLNPTPGKVQDPKFHDGEFFDPRDIVQVKYEMLRRVSVESASVTSATEEYSVSRPTYYQTKASFEEAGIAGLVPRKRGPRGPHKVRGAVLAFVEEQLVAGEPIRARQLAKQIQKRFDLDVHPRTIERAVAVKKTRHDARRWRGLGAVIGHRGAIRSSPQCRTRSCAAARGSLGAPAFSPSRHVGVDTGDGHACWEPAAAGETWSIVELPSRRRIQNRYSYLRGNGHECRASRSNTMSESLKVQPHHVERGAYLYVRQSSMRQVIQNVESTKRQYALRSRAIALGWREDQIVVVDSDQGESGASAAWREGFQHLVADVSMGHAGIVMGLEVSRLARNNADWHRLLEICALADTSLLRDVRARRLGVPEPSRCFARRASTSHPGAPAVASRSSSH